MNKRQIVFTSLFFMGISLSGCARVARTNEPGPPPPTGAEEGTDLRAAPGGSPAAQIGSWVITQEEVDRTLGNRLKAIEHETYEVRKERLDQLIEAKLWELEASLRAIEVPELKRQLGEEREAFLAALRRKYDVRVALQPPRFAVSGQNRPVRGRLDAPVTLVEFSDFECPYCKSFQPTLREIQSRYPDQVRFVFKHNPLPFHAKARLAHLAALCAGEHGKFWEYRDRLFEGDGGLEEEALVRYAQELGLETESFGRCLDEERYASVVDEDLSEGEQLGVHGTPTFFVNGRMLSGAKPFSSFSKIIDEELEAVGH